MSPETKVDTYGHLIPNANRGAPRQRMNQRSLREGNADAPRVVFGPGIGLWVVAGLTGRRPVRFLSAVAASMDAKLLTALDE